MYRFGHLTLDKEVYGLWSLPHKTDLTAEVVWVII